MKISPKRDNYNLCLLFVKNRIQSPLAKLYTTSTMEHHHFNQCIIILHNNVSGAYGYKLE